MVNLKIKVKKAKDNELATLRALKDTGASIDCVEERFVRKHNLEILLYSPQMINWCPQKKKLSRFWGQQN